MLFSPSYIFMSYIIIPQLDEMLEKRGVKVDKVLNFAIDDSVLEERITGRWIHPSSGRTYHTKYAPPKVPGKDDVSRHYYTLILICIKL